MRRYSIKRYWELSDTVEVEAESVEDAIVKAHAITIDRTGAEYVPDSINSDPETDVQVIKKRNA